MERVIHPVSNVRLRAGILAGLIVLLLFSDGAWTMKLLAAALMLFFTGSFRRASIDGNKLETQLTLGFVPLRAKKYKLSRFAEIEIDVDSGIDVGMIVVGVITTVCLWMAYTQMLPWFLVGPFGVIALVLSGVSVWLIWKGSDRLLPWFGGRYRLRLRSLRGNQILVWQGNREDHFDDNLETLRTATGLPIERRGAV